MQTHGRARIGGLRLGRHQGQTAGRKTLGEFRADETGGRARRPELAQVASVREKAERPLPRLGERGDKVDGPVGVFAIRNARLGDPSELARRDRAEVFIETRIGH